MDADTTITALVLALGAMTTGALGFAVAWIRARERALRAEQRLVDRSASGDERAERFERALDAMAIDLERLAEGQRFTTKLLAERAAPGHESNPLPASPIAHHTPH
jgi:hypothetical protein